MSLPLIPWFWLNSTFGMWLLGQPVLYPAVAFILQPLAHFILADSSSYVISILSS